MIDNTTCTIYIIGIIAILLGIYDIIGEIKR